MNRFDHAGYLKTIDPNAPLCYGAPAFCLVCEAPILPSSSSLPCAYPGLRA
jgi:hypothetical protein